MSNLNSFIFSDTAPLIEDLISKQKLLKFLRELRTSLEKPESIDSTQRYKRILSLYKNKDLVVDEKEPGELEKFRKSHNEELKKLWNGKSSESPLWIDETYNGLKAKV
jgi:hypothetical protein